MLTPMMAPCLRSVSSGGARYAKTEPMRREGGGKTGRSQHDQEHEAAQQSAAPRGSGRPRPPTISLGQGTPGA